MTFAIKKYDYDKSDIPMKTMLNIIVDEYGEIGPKTYAISSKLISAVEVDEAVDSLIKELEVVRREAKQALRS